ncbi:zinc-binding dehydrogenase [Neobacillus sp. KR4-4]|uniref:zinc-dependent alcohol dehydrogenase n=1 Tax=Neobacillus sp. KR4-4 TaxID=3344872 RepID=UPI0035CC8BA5
MDLMKAAVFEGPKKISMHHVPRPNVEPGWSLIKVNYCGICGTDMNIYAGSHPRAQTSLVVGHEFSGEVVEHPTLLPGTFVTALPLLSCGECESCKLGHSHVYESLRLLGIDEAGGMSEYVRVPADDVYPLPNGMSLKKGALVEPLAVAVHAVRESSFKPGDSATVFGAGPIGLFVAIVLRLFGSNNISIVEVNPFRKKLAEELGFKVSEDSINGPSNDIVFDCAAHPKVAEQLVNATKIRGQIVLVGTYKYPAELDLQNITFKEISLKGTRVYTKKDYEIAISVLKQDVDFERIITQELSLEKVDHAFEMIAKNGDCVKILISI